MEGWDGSNQGSPTDLVRRRWNSFGASGAKLIWGCEATAIQHEARANPNQLCLGEDTVDSIASLRSELVSTHEQQFGTSDDLLVGLQLTHSGRFCRPNSKDILEPISLYRHALLDKKFGFDGNHYPATDEEIEEIISKFIKASTLAQQAGFDFIDVKHCHGYLGHEFLSAIDRPGRYGGSFENRTRFLREVISGIRRRSPDLLIGVRLSAFDLIPFEPHTTSSIGIPSTPPSPYRHGFGTSIADPTDYDLNEPFCFVSLLQELGVYLINLTAGSPYYNPHIQRPALFPPSDGYTPPEDPLIGVARQVDVVRQFKKRFPSMTIVGSGYSYLQEWLPHVGSAIVDAGHVDSVGLGRMALSYPYLPRDLIAGKPLERKRICRTFSDCTTAPRNGLISGCFPLDPFYKSRVEAKILKNLKSLGLDT
jgi:2,4-dienoyl-CoA reductase-like NADH-dependent reductase (Old Yellow Enzyme family)